MDDATLAGQLLMSGHGPYSEWPPPNTPPDARDERLVREVKVGGIMINKQADAASAAKFANTMRRWGQEATGVPLLVTADFEHGCALMVGGSTNFPFNLALGASRSAGLARTSARITAQEIRALGYNGAFGPVADVNTNPANPIIGIRSFGERPELVAAMIRAEVQAFRAHGVIATLKHFPGHGDTKDDSHVLLPRVRYDRATLERIHLAPFKAGIEAGVSAIMTAHIIVDAIDPDLPATLSSKVLKGLLRDDLGFEGIVVTDGMAMDAIVHNWGYERAAVMAAKAGADIILDTGGAVDIMHRALIAAMASGELPRADVRASVERTVRVKLENGLFDTPPADPERADRIVGQETSLAAADRAYARTITLVRNNGAVLPFDPAAKATTLVAGLGWVRETADSVESASSASGGSVVRWSWWDATGTDDERIAQVVALADGADRIVVPSESYSGPSEQTRKLVAALTATGRPVAVVGLRLPYEAAVLPAASAYVAAYCTEPPAFPAAAAVLFGARPSGRLPVTVSTDHPYGHGLTY